MWDTESNLARSGSYECCFRAVPLLAMCFISFRGRSLCFGGIYDPMKGRLVRPLRVSSARIRAPGIGNGRLLKTITARTDAARVGASDSILLFRSSSYQLVLIPMSAIKDVTISWAGLAAPGAVAAGRFRLIALVSLSVWPRVLKAKPNRMHSSTYLDSAGSACPATTAGPVIDHALVISLASALFYLVERTRTRGEYTLSQGCTRYMQSFKQAPLFLGDGKLT